MQDLLVQYYSLAKECHLDMMRMCKAIGVWGSFNILSIPALIDPRFNSRMVKKQ